MIWSIDSDDDDDERRSFKFRGSSPDPKIIWEIMFSLCHLFPLSSLLLLFLMTQRRRKEQRFSTNSICSWRPVRFPLCFPAKSWVHFLVSLERELVLYQRKIPLLLHDWKPSYFLSPTRSYSRRCDYLLGCGFHVWTQLLLYFSGRLGKRLGKWSYFTQTSLL